MSLLHATTAPSSAPVFRDISADDEEQQPHEIESLCMNCYKNGMTRLLLTKVPFFREIIVSSFNCDSCNWSNTEIQSAGRIQDQGVRYSLSVRSKRDVDREVVKTDYATMRIPEIDFEIPACTQKGALTTIEGILERTIVGLQQEQPHRRAENAQVAEKIDVFITKLKSLKDGETPFTCIIDDPSGNSFVENPFAPQKDEALTVTHYRRSQEQDSLLGIESVDGQKNTEEKPEDLKDEVLQFHTNCPECNAPAATNMKLVQIPHFKEVIIMATNCDACGHRTNEVKSGGAIEPLGTRITLHITDPSDLTRDVLKSETCSLSIPELEFDLGMGALGGKFTTLEGLLKDIKDLVVDKNPFTLGDSSTSDRKEKLQEFGRKIDQILEGQIKVHFVLEDSAGNSYLQNVYAPEEDPEMKVEKYERSFEQNEDLGLNDMKTEGYEEHEPSSC
ncbi:zinc finger protein ZPR1 isoform X1 [Hyla sarda]|uniref:zinc finger protein ZPR1 isoform X1 n=1 Tax=Hyla sarda TaxID=327740 RepID=UPI0024C255AD|nr:zinc finger protein ZPR1 isoform X1 [Hyla sarda]